MADVVGQIETVSLKSSDLADMLDVTRVRGFHLLALATIDAAILWVADWSLPTFSLLE